MVAVEHHTTPVASCHHAYPLTHRLRGIKRGHATHLAIEEVLRRTTHKALRGIGLKLYGAAPHRAAHHTLTASYLLIEKTTVEAYDIADIDSIFESALNFERRHPRIYHLAKTHREVHIPHREEVLALDNLSPLLIFEVVLQATRLAALATVAATLRCRA